MEMEAPFDGKRKILNDCRSDGVFLSIKQSERTDLPKIALPYNKNEH